MHCALCSGHAHGPGCRGWGADLWDVPCAHTWTPPSPSHCELLWKPVPAVLMHMLLISPEPPHQPGAWCFSFLDPPALTT